MTHPKRLHNIIFQLRFPGRSIFPELSRAYSLQHSDSVLETATDSKSVIDINIKNEYYLDTHTEFQRWYQTSSRHVKENLLL